MAAQSADPSAEVGKTSRSALDDCAITRPGAEIGIPIVANDDPDQPPQLLHIEDPNSALFFSAADDGLLAIFEAPETTSGLHTFHYQAVYADAPATPATVFVLINGDQPLPEASLQDPRLAPACSRAVAHRTLEPAPGDVVPVPAAGELVKVDVLAFADAGAKIQLTDPVFRPPVSAKYIEVEGGVLVFLEDGRTVFLAGADRIDLDLQAQYVLPGRFRGREMTAEEMLELAKAETGTRAPPEPVRTMELAVNHHVIWDPLPGKQQLPPVERTSFPRCDETACRIFEYDGSAYVMVADTGGAAGSARAPASGAVRLADASALPFGIGSLVPGAPLLVALDGGGGDVGRGDLAAYWLEQKPDTGVVIIDGFFDGTPGTADEPSFSVGGSRFVPAGVLLETAAEVALPGFAEPVREIGLSAFPPRHPAHGGGAGFSAIDFGDLGSGLVPLLEQDPTTSPRGPGPQGIVEPRPPALNRAPIAQDDLFGVPPDGAIAIDVLANDFDPDPGDGITTIRTIRPSSVRETGTADGNALDAQQVTDDQAPGLRFELSRGTVTVLEDENLLLYEPEPGFKGIERFTYTVTDQRGSESQPATVTVVVDNDAPVVRNDEATTDPGVPVTIEVLANDVDPDDAPGFGLRIASFSDGGAGRVTRSEDAQALVYTPAEGFVGADTFSYRASDLIDLSGTATVTVHVGNLPPVANDDGALAQVGGPGVVVDVLANDLDSDGDPLTIALLGTATRGTATIEDGEVIYRPPDPGALPDADRPGRIEDAFGYSIGDGRGGEDTALVRVELNRAPEAASDLAQATGRTVTIDVLANDFDLDGDALEITGVGETVLGAELRVDGGQIVYTRPAGVGEGEPFADFFAYAIGDGRGGSASATVTVFDGPQIPPTLIVEPSQTILSVAPDFAFATQAPFPEAFGVAQDDLTLDRARSVSIELFGSEAAFDNALGWYRIEDGAPVDPRILFANVKDVDPTLSDAQARLGTLPEGTEFGFFLIQDGFAQNGDLLDPAGEFVFRGEAGALRLFRIDDGSERAIEGDIVHTVDDLNPGELAQAVSGLDDAGGFAIGFEDKVRADPTQGSDDDFDDAVFTLSYGNIIPPGLELTVDILDPDSELMSRASVAITAATRQPGDRLVFDNVLDRGGAAITLTGEGTERLELAGPAAQGEFERVLEAVELEVDRAGPERELEFRVVDADGQPGNTEIVIVATDAGAPAGGLDALLDVGAANVIEVT